MTFTIRLERTSCPIQPCEVPEYDPTVNSIVSLLEDICECLDESGAVSFAVGGFGQEAWPVDVVTDLPVVLEQLPDLCAAIAAGQRTATLEFYEQGVQRCLVFRSHENDMEIECKSDTEWHPHPNIIRHPRNLVVQMLRELRDAFVALVADVAPAVLRHQWFLSWRQQTDSL